MNATDFDYGKSDFWTWDEAMYDHLRWLRENDPIHWSEKSKNAMPVGRCQRT